MQRFCNLEQKNAKSDPFQLSPHSTSRPPFSHLCCSNDSRDKIIGVSLHFNQILGCEDREPFLGCEKIQSRTFNVFDYNIFQRWGWEIREAIILLRVICSWIVNCRGKINIKPFADWSLNTFFLLPKEDSSCLCSDSPSEIDAILLCIKRRKAWSMKWNGEEIAMQLSKILKLKLTVHNFTNTWKAQREI